ncbi:MAG: dihydropteroate synthase [Lachnospiraceae bacterium]|jgi:5-methyltetrahydrofolate--homocysteine methyltransferase|nr:dihydropteroate synthase [Lachnospiraceae bacterium]
MTKEEFQKFVESGHPVYLDGATGSNLLKRGMPAGVCPEEWILGHKEVLLALQKEFAEAGSHVIYAPTFSANAVKLREYGLEDRIGQMNQELVAISKEAAGGKCLVAGDLTMTGEQLAPMGTMDFEELVNIYKEQIGYLVNAGADLLVVETMMSLQESRAALIAAKECCDLPVMVTMTFESDGRTLYGTDAKTAAVVLESLGASAIGANCSTGPDKMAEIITAMAEVSSVPIIAKPNAGLPFLDKNGNTSYDMDSDTFADGMVKLVEAGASILGGCCGTSPEYIGKLKERTHRMKTVRRKKPDKRYLTSERKTVEFGLEDNFIIVGERINPTGKKKLQEQLRTGSLDMVLQFAEEQEACGAGILDVNMGMSGIDEKAMMLNVLEEVAGVTSLPLAIDSSHVEVLEAALRRYPGRALINSISYEKIKFENLLPIAKKYGAMFILLPLSDKGLPESLEEKKEIIHKIADRAKELGMDKTDIVVDGLVTTVGANKKAALETLEAIRYCKEMGYATICGLSNISFGLPGRGYVNAAFLTMAIQEGLTMAIANPSQELLTCSAFAADLLMDKKEADIRYIQQMSGREEIKSTVSKNTTANKEVLAKESAVGGGKSASPSEKVREDVLKGNKKRITEDTKQALDSDLAPGRILNEILLPAINEVGDLFDKGKYFLPQLIASAEAMKIAIEYLEPLLQELSDRKEMPTVVIATVEGDIHDIGKNLVALMLKNHGFQVIDLGKDVPKEKIIEAAKESHASIIALSALMTTTMQEMRKVIAYAKEQGVDAKVIIGGAVITQDYADEIGADGYSKDAADAVKLAKRILDIEK